MQYVNVGAIFDGRRVKSKAELKKLLKDNSALLRFDQTSCPIRNVLPPVIMIKDLTTGITLSVVGPDPYEKREWYASITINGKLTVK